MVIQDPATAQIRLILASNDASQVQQLTHDLYRSKYSYLFSHHSQRKNLLAALAREIAQDGGMLPIVLVIDYKFAGKDCEALLRLAQRAARKGAVECVVTNPPPDEGVRQRLAGLGAKLFEGDADLAPSELTLH